MTDDASWYSNDTATFGDRLAAARDDARMTQAALAGKLGVRKSTLIAWEEDLKEPRANRLQMLSGLLGVSLSWLLTGEGEGPPPPQDAMPITADLMDMLTEMRTLRTQIATSAEKLARLEKRLRANLQRSA